MPTSSRLSTRGEYKAVIILLLVTLLVAAAYAPGIVGGTLHFDDADNLDSLTHISLGASPVDFVFGGRAGPLGRPIALATFLPQAHAWPHTPSDFLYTNVLIHILNGMLVAWLFYLLSIIAGRTRPDGTWIAVTGAVIWMAFPLLASSSLFIVQRMTLLSATFMILGLIAYLWARIHLISHPRHAYLCMSAAVVVFTALAAFTKENGILLPVLILITEITLLRQKPIPSLPSTWRIWQALFLYLPSALIVGYLASRLHYTESTVLMREFTASDRLLTQFHTLWHYLGNAFLPRPSALGPFHDHVTAYTNWLSPLSLAAVGGWLAAITLAIIYRRKAPWALFAVGWYIGAHALESTSVPLELYFEHRNYIPLIGPTIALTSVLFSLPKHLQPIIRIGIALYVTLLLVVLHSTASLWGQPALAAEMWAKHNPSSIRATQFLAEQLEKEGAYSTSRRVLSRHFREHPRHVSVGLQQIGLSCLMQLDHGYNEMIEQIRLSIPTAQFGHGVASSLELLYNFAIERRCDFINKDEVVELARLTLSNRAFSLNPVAAHNINLLLAQEGFAQRDLANTMAHLELAIEAINAPSTVVYASQILQSAGLDAAAETIVAEAIENVPRNPLRAAIWRRQFRELTGGVTELLQREL